MADIDSTEATLEERLRSPKGDCAYDEDHAMFGEAADEIERLRRELRRATAFPPIADVCADCGQTIPVRSRWCKNGREGGHRMIVSKEAREKWESENG